MNAIAATIVVVVSLLLPPVAYSIAAYSHLLAVMETEDEIHGAAVSEAISAAPQLWTFQEVRFAELLARSGVHTHPADQLLRLVDNEDKLVAAVGESPAWSIITRKATVFDAGRPVGRLQVERSLRNMILNTGSLAALGLVLAAGSYVTLRVIPLRATQRANAGLQQRDAALSFANIVLKASMVGSPEGMILVDKQARVLGFNQNFVDIYRLPRELLEAGPDQPVLAMVASRQRDPEAFAARVNYLYDHPDESCHDRLELNDGRILERHSTSLYDSEHRYLGRIWFVRDITERETLQEALRSSEGKFRNLVESTTDFIWEIDESARYTYVSPAAKALFGYEPAELIGKSPFDIMSEPEAIRVAAEFAEIERHRRAFSRLENTIIRKDGSEIVLETNDVPIVDTSGSYRGYRGIDRDITPRKLAELALLERDALLHVIAISSAEFVAASSVDDVISKTLELVSNTVRIDRAAVLEKRRAITEAPILRHVWQAPDVSVKLEPGFFDNPSLLTPDILAWQAPLQQGKVVLTDARSTAGDVRSLLEGLGTRTILVVPIHIDGKYWGQVGFESCKSERHWQDFDVEILRTLAELIGSAIQRERYVKEIADANQIIQNAPTILYRLAGNPSLPVTYISHNIKLFGYDPAALTVSPQFLMNIVHPDETAMVRDALAAALEEKSRPP